MAFLEYKNFKGECLIKVIYPNYSKQLLFRVIGMYNFDQTKKQEDVAFLETGLVKKQKLRNKWEGH